MFGPQAGSGSARQTGDSSLNDRELVGVFAEHSAMHDGLADSAEGLERMAAAAIKLSHQLAAVDAHQLIGQLW